MNCWSYPDHIKQCKNEGKIFKTLVWEKKHNLCFFNICSQVFCVVVLDESFSIPCLVCCVAMLLCCCVAILLDDLWTWYWVLTYNLFFFPWAAVSVDGSHLAMDGCCKALEEYLYTQKVFHEDENPWAPCVEDILSIFMNCGK